MKKYAISNGTLHKITDEMNRGIIQFNLVEPWNSLTDIQRNEWICWVTSPRKPETKIKRLELFFKQLKEGKKRPCCWPGCPHHNPKNQKWHKGCV